MTYSKLILLMFPTRLNKFSPCKLFFDQRSRLHNDLCSQVRAQFPIMGTRGMERVVIHCLNQKLNLERKTHPRKNLSTTTIRIAVLFRLNSVSPALQGDDGRCVCGSRRQIIKRMVTQDARACSTHTYARGGTAAAPWLLCCHLKHLDRSGLMLTGVQSSPHIGHHSAQIICRVI